MKVEIAQYAVGVALVLCVLLGSNVLGVIWGD
jgi:hypothetical protein